MVKTTDIFQAVHLVPQPFPVRVPAPSLALKLQPTLALTLPPTQALTLISRMAVNGYITLFVRIISIRSPLNRFADCYDLMYLNACDFIACLQ